MFAATKQKPASLDEQIKAAGLEASALEREVRAAEASLRELKGRHGSATYKVIGLMQTKSAQLAEVEAAKQAAAREQRRKDAIAERVAEFDAAIIAAQKEKADPVHRDFPPAIAALNERIASLTAHRAELAATA